MTKIDSPSHSSFDSITSLLRHESFEPLKEGESMTNSKGQQRNYKRGVNRRALIHEAVMICSLDLGKKEHAYCCMGADRKVLDEGKVAHHPEAIEALLIHADELRQRHGLHEVVYFMEGAGPYWMVVASTLERHGQVYRLVNNRSVKHERQLESLTHEKSDRRDAQHIGRLACSLHFTPTQLLSGEPWISLRAAACEYQAIVDLEIKEKTRIRALLEMAMPQYSDIFTKIESPSFLAILGALGHAKEEKSFLVEARRRFTGKAFQVARAKEFRRQWVDPHNWGYIPAREAIAFRLGLSAERYQLLLRQERQVAERLRACYEQVPYSSFIDSIPGSSTLQNAVTVGLAGDLRLYDESRCLVKLAGLNPCENSSGLYEGRTRISKAGRTRLRRAAVTSVMAILKSHLDLDFSRRFYYLRSRQENPLSALQALVACANKYLRTMWWLAIHRTAYDTVVSTRGMTWAKHRREEEGIRV
jgi:transposase